MINVDYKAKAMNLVESIEDSGIEVVEHMLNTTEDSPFHREQNVWVHTRMVFDEYCSMVETWDRHAFMGAIVCIFHDFGKPMSEESKVRTDGSTYRSYKGHEVISGAWWLDFWCNNYFNLKDFLPNPIDAYNVMVMIAYHLPYQLGERVDELVSHINHFGLQDTFSNVLRADGRGRISDEGEKNISNSDAWIATHITNNDVKPDISIINDVYIMTGVPASGKSTAVKNIDDAYVFSFDNIREESFPEFNTYSEKFKAFNEYDFKNDKTLHEKWGVSTKIDNQINFLNQAIVESYKNCTGNFVVDNTSVTVKSRRTIKHLVKSVNKDSTFGSVFLMVSIDKAIKNNELRSPYKNVPENVIRSMYYRTTPPILGEFSMIMLVDGMYDE